MKIDFVRSGGFAGLRLARTFDTSTMPSPQGSKLEGLVQEVGFFDLPDIAPPEKPVPDSYQYRVTISSGAKTRAIVVTETSMPDQIRPLIDYLASLVKSADTP